MTPASPSSTPPTPTATRSAAPRSCSATRSRGSATSSCVATKFGGRRATGPTTAPGRRARYVMPGRRGQPAAAADRPPRPLPAARAVRRHADRGDAVGADRPGPPGQGPLPRLLQLRRLAGRRRRLDRAHRRPGALRVGAEPLLPARPRPRGRGGARPARPTASGCCPTSRSSTACSPASTTAASRRPTGSRADARARPGAAGWTNADWDRIEALTAYAEERDLSVLDVAIAGLAAQPDGRLGHRRASRRATRCVPTPPRCAGSRPRPTSSSSTRSRRSRREAQATCSDRFERPIQNPSMTWRPGSSGSVAAPRVTKSGV